MTKSIIMKLPHRVLTDNSKFCFSINQIGETVFYLQEFMKGNSGSDIESDIIEFRLREIQTNLTRAKKALREIVTNNNNKK